LISVCMATYNGELWIEQQLRSILGQLNSEDELIISDDGSTDRTIKIIEQFNDTRINVLEASEHLGPTKNFERALRVASGELIFLCDQDDLWVENKVELIKTKLAHFDLVMHDARLIDGKGTVISESYFAERTVRMGLINNMLYNGYTGAFMAFRKELLDIALPIPKGVPHDQWLGVVAEITGTVSFVREPLVFWRRHEKTVTSLTRKRFLTAIKIIPSRIILMFELAKRKFQINKLNDRHNLEHYK